MAPHPAARAVLAAPPGVPLTRDTLDEARAEMSAAVASDVGRVAGPARIVDVDAGGVPCRLYGTGTGAVVYVHGGGWVMGGLDTHDGLCRRLAVRGGCPVLAVDYRLAPEQPYPAAIADVERAVDWLRGPSAARYGLEPARIAVAGDSAGGHLAAVVARRARDRGANFAHQTLVYPVIDPAAAYPDLDAYGLDRTEMAFYWDAYAPSTVDRGHPDVAPLRADLRGLPPAFVVTAEYDVLRDEGEAYADALADAGVPVVAVRYLGMVHGFARKLARFQAAATVIDQIAVAVRGAVSAP